MSSNTFKPEETADNTEQLPEESRQESSLQSDDETKPESLSDEGLETSSDMTGISTLEDFLLAMQGPEVKPDSGASEESSHHLSGRRSSTFSVTAAPPRFAVEETLTHDDFATDTFVLQLPSSRATSLEFDSDVTSVIQRQKLTSEEKRKSDGSTEDENSQIDRQLYYEMYNRLTLKHKEAKLKNTFLQSKVSEYYMNKKLFYVFKDSKEESSLSTTKYELLLDELEDCTDSVALIKQHNVYEVENLKHKFRLLEERVTTSFDKLQEIEREHTKQFVESDPGKQKFVDRCLRRQKNELQALSKLRLQYIKLRNKMTDKQNELDSLVNLGPNLHLSDYEQLKFDNRNLQDKLEEKEKELKIIRAKCRNSMQILAHKRERSSELEMNITTLNEQLEEVLGEYEEAREQLQGLKAETNVLRCKISKMKENSGLLSKPVLLRDMQNAISEVKGLTKKLDKFKGNYRRASELVSQFRKRLQGSEISLGEFEFEDTSASKGTSPGNSGSVKFWKEDN